MVGAPDIFFVPAQFPSIQEAVDAVVGATTIMVEPGYYNESVVVKDKECIVIVSTALSRRGVTIIGNDRGVTNTVGPGASLTGDDRGTNNKAGTAVSMTGNAGSDVPHAVRPDAVSDVLCIERSTVHLSGLVIRSDGRLRGICARDSSLSLQECVVACNRVSSRAYSGGVGAGMAGESSSTVGAGKAGESSSAVGAGIACWNSSVRIQKTAVIGNVVESMAETPVELSEFRVQALACSNSTSNLKAGTRTEALGGGLYFHVCRVEIAGCTIQGNAAYSPTAARGGGIWCWNTSMRMWRSRVTDNALRGSVCEGGGIYFKDAAGCELGGSVITGSGFPEGYGAGVFIEGDPSAVSIHRNTSVKLNFPDDVHLVTKQVEAKLP